MNYMLVKNGTDKSNNVCAPLGTIAYHNSEDKLHREDGPALIHPNSSKSCWYINGLLHREDGPAVVDNVL